MVCRVLGVAGNRGIGRERETTTQQSHAFRRSERPFNGLNETDQNENNKNLAMERMAQSRMKQHLESPSRVSLSVVPNGLLFHDVQKNVKMELYNSPFR